MNLLDLTTVSAPYVMDQGEIQGAVRGMFGDAEFDLEKAERIFKSAGIDSRGFALPLERYARGFTAAEHHTEFRRVATEMLRTAAERIVPQELTSKITHVVTVSTSGIATPTLECAVMDEIPLSRDARRVPIFGLGCGGGVAGLQIARDLACSRPDALVLVLCVELTSLTLFAQDMSLRNFVACAIFGDGAAGALVSGSEVPAGCEPLARLGQGSTRLFPGSHELMGWQVEDKGWRVVFSPRIPGVVEREVKGIIEGVTNRSELKHFGLHPGGRKVLEAYENALDLNEHEMAPARNALRKNGNMSAASVFFTLDEIFTAPDFTPGPGVATAFGPGFTSEALSIDFLKSKGSRS
ncbi:MAG: alkylresorcinol/alkylpyrone synthase [Planctomycetota bacterium]